MLLERNIGMTKISIEGTLIGSDLLVVLRGGDDEHIGSVSVTIPFQSAYRNAITFSTSTISLPGHKDYVLSNKIAEQLSKKLRRKVAVIVGIHIDNISPKMLSEVIKAATKLTDELVKRIPQISHATFNEDLK